MASVQIKLSSPELIVALKTLGFADYPPMAGALVATLPSEQIKGALAAARACLIARDLASASASNADTQLVLSDALAAHLLVAAVPEAQFWLVSAPGAEAHSTYFNWTRAFMQRTWRTADDVNVFETSESDTSLAVQIVQAMPESARPSGAADGNAWTVNESLLRLFKREGVGANEEEHRAQLQAAGVPAASQNDLLAVAQTPDLRLSLLGLSNVWALGGKSAGLVAIAKEGRGWLAMQPGGGTAVLTSLSAAALHTMVATIVKDVCESSTPLEQLIRDAA